MAYVKEKNTATLDDATNEDVTALIADKTADKISHLVIHGFAQIDDTHLTMLVEFIKDTASIHNLEYHQGSEDSHVGNRLADALSANPHIARCIFRLGDCTISHDLGAPGAVTQILRDLKKAPAVTQQEEALAQTFESKLIFNKNIIEVYPHTKRLQEHVNANADETSYLIHEIMDMEKDFASPPPAYAANASSKPPSFESRFAAIKERLPAIICQTQSEVFAFSPERLTEFLRFLQGRALGIGKDLEVEQLTGPLSAIPLTESKPVLGAFTSKAVPHQPGTTQAINDNKGPDISRGHS